MKAFGGGGRGKLSVRSVSLIGPASCLLGPWKLRLDWASPAWRSRGPVKDSAQQISDSILVPHQVSYKDTTYCRHHYVLEPSI